MFLLYDLQSPINIGQILRSSEQFGIPVSLYDARDVLNEHNVPVISDFSCGALARRMPSMVHSYHDARRAHTGRFIATCMSPAAKKLPEFAFMPGDVVLLGNEYDGLPQHVIEDCDAMLYIPLPEAVIYKPQSFSPIDPSRSKEVAQNGIPNLSVAMTAAIIGYQMYAQRHLGVSHAATNAANIFSSAAST